MMPDAADTVRDHDFLCPADDATSTIMTIYWQVPANVVARIYLQVTTRLDETVGIILPLEVGRRRKNSTAKKQKTAGKIDGAAWARRERAKRNENKTDSYSVLLPAVIMPRR